jgi:RND family efflux transporter MFP subunit
MAESNRLNLNFCHVTAPIAGRISRRYVDPGNLVRADETVLTRIVTQDPIFAYFDVDERTLLKIRRLISEGKVQSARTSELWVALALADEQGFDDESGKPRHRALFDFADNRVDPTTGTLQVRAKIANPMLTEGVRLFSAGMFVRVRLPVGDKRQAIVIPEKALGTDQGQKFVFVIKETSEKGQSVMRVSQRTIKVGSLHDGYRVIESGLNPGEKIVTSGLQRIRDGAKVAPTADEGRAKDGSK